MVRRMARGGHVFVTEGLISVDDGGRHEIFGPGEMCQVAPSVEQADAAGVAGASYFLAWRASTVTAKLQPAT
jgi:hypothetical protein